MADAEKALDKIDIASELKTLSPIEARSIELKQQADEIEISDKASYIEAKKVRRELISHRTSTKDLRLTFTRKLDNLKDQFIKKQDEVLEPSIAGEETIKSKIASWEREEQERKEAEEKRMQAIVDTFKMPDTFDRKTASVEDVNRVRAYIKAELSLLAPNDRTKVAVKNAVSELRQKLDDEQAYILDRIEQEKEAERQKEERRKLEEERKAEEDRKAKEAAAATPINTDVQGGMDALVDQPKAEVPTPAIPPKETLEPISKIVSDIAKKHVEVVDKEMTTFLKKQGYEVDPHNVQATIDMIRAKGYRFIDEVENIYEGTFMKQKHTYQYVRVVDQLTFTTEAKLVMPEE